MATTDAVSSSTTSSTYALDTTRNSLDQEAFLSLLITELQNQDPLNPMEDKDFIAQLAQFSSLEQMQALNASMEALGANSYASQAVAMIGRTVDYADVEAGVISGIVDSVSFEAGYPKLNVGAASVELSNVINVH